VPRFFDWLRNGSTKDTRGRVRAGLRGESVILRRRPQAPRGHRKAPQGDQCGHRRSQEIKARQFGRLIAEETEKCGQGGQVLRRTITSSSRESPAIVPGLFRWSCSIRESRLSNRPDDQSGLRNVRFCPVSSRLSHPANRLQWATSRLSRCNESREKGQWSAHRGTAPDKAASFLVP
jgi:hypothetical protein